MSSAENFSPDFALLYQDPVEGASPPAPVIPKASSPPERPSPSLEVLHELEISNQLVELQARLESLEIDLTRVAAAREEDARRVAGEMAVLKARVEDALEAIGTTSKDLRGALASLQAKLKEAEAAEARAVTVREGERTELESRLESLTTQTGQLRSALLHLAERLGGGVVVTRRVADLEVRIAELSARVDHPFDI